jgi:hypothetical protein
MVLSKAFKENRDQTAKFVPALLPVHWPANYRRGASALDVLNAKIGMSQPQAPSLPQVPLTTKQRFGCCTRIQAQDGAVESNVHTVDLQRERPDQTGWWSRGGCAAAVTQQNAYRTIVAA